MKYIKIIFFLTVAIIFYSCEFNNNPSSTTSAIVNRKVLVEFATHVNCTNCPPPSHYLDLIDTAIAGITSSDTNVIIIKEHNSIGSGPDPFYNFNTTVCSERKTYYNVESNPTGYLNGSLMPSYNSQTWTNSINLALAKSETQSLTLSNTIDTSSRNGTLSISLSQLSGSAPSDLKLFVAVTESKLYYGSGTNGEKWFNNILRDFLTDVDGLSVSLPYNGSINYAITSGINIANASIVVFTQSTSSDKEVFVVRKIKLVE
jgi:hypothetical protein